jgi:hypothetical protein
MLTGSNEVGQHERHHEGEESTHRRLRSMLRRVIGCDIEGAEMARESNHSLLRHSAVARNGTRTPISQAADHGDLRAQQGYTDCYRAGSDQALPPSPLRHTEITRRTEKAPAARRPPRQRLRPNHAIASASAARTWIHAIAHRRLTC